MTDLGYVQVFILIFVVICIYCSLIDLTVFRSFRSLDQAATVATPVITPTLCFSVTRLISSTLYHVAEEEWREWIFQQLSEHEAPAGLHTILFALTTAIKFTSSICIYHQAWMVRSNQKPNTRREIQGSGWHVKKNWGEVLTCWCLSR